MQFLWAFEKDSVCVFSLPYTVYIYRYLCLANNEPPNAIRKQIPPMRNGSPKYTTSSHPRANEKALLRTNASTADPTPSPMAMMV